eukprot:6194428-Pleurochrysis_carterae.AAC.4
MFAREAVQEATSKRTDDIFERARALPSYFDVRSMCESPMNASAAQTRRVLVLVYPARAAARAATSAAGADSTHARTRAPPPTPIAAGRRGAARGTGTDLIALRLRVPHRRGPQAADIRDSREPLAFAGRTAAESGQALQSCALLIGLDLFSACCVRRQNHAEAVLKLQLLLSAKPPKEQQGGIGRLGNGRGFRTRGHLVPAVRALCADPRRAAVDAGHDALPAPLAALEGAGVRRGTLAAAMCAPLRADRAGRAFIRPRCARMGVQ